MSHKYLVFSVLCFLSGCGGFLSGTSQNIVVNSNVEGADVYVGNVLKCHSPCSIEMEKKSSDHIVTLKAQGYKDASIRLKSSVNVMTSSNVSNLSAGALTDLWNGGFWAYNQDALYVTLKKKTPGARVAPGYDAETSIRKYAIANYMLIQREAFSCNEKGEYSLALSRKTGLPVKTIWDHLDRKQTPYSFADDLINTCRAQKVGGF